MMSKASWPVGRSLRRALLASCAVLGVTPTASLAQNLVLNPGFETTTGCAAANWTVVGICPGNYVFEGGGGQQHSGTVAYVVVNASQPNNISQAIPVTAGKYSFSFWYEFLTTAPGGSFNASVGSNSFNVSAVSLGSYTQLTQQITLPAGTTTVAFGTSSGFFEYAIDDVSLTFLQSLLLTPLLPPNAPINPTNVAGAIDGFINAGGTLPAGFQNLFNLTPQQLTSALTQASGETATGSQQTTFNAMTQFMGVMTDPSIAGRGGNAGAGDGGVTGYAQDDAMAYAHKHNSNDALTAIYSKAPMARNYDPRWSVWAAGFGGSQTTDGNASVGSSTSNSRVYGTAVGADYLFSPHTIAGFSMAGGGTNFSVAGSGGGHSELFQVGAFVRHERGAAYITAALAYGWQNVTTNRTVTIAGIDQLQAKFNANSYSGRVEGGYRFVSPWAGGIGFTPYVAGQFTTFDLPAYAEQALVGANTFALAYNSQSVTDTRSELGLRTDKSFALTDAILALRGRAAWAHDYNPNRAVAATFQALPGASFVVNGASQASDSALTTASAELKWMNGWAAAATFEGEFSNVTRSYAGKGLVRYVW
jgi:hypothetical protein